MKELSKTLSISVIRDAASVYMNYLNYLMTWDWSGRLRNCVSFVNDDFAIVFVVGDYSLVEVIIRFEIMLNYLLIQGAFVPGGRCLL